MKYTNSISTLVIAATLIVLSGQALASDGTITFNGSVDASTCTIAAAGGGTSFTVQLPQVSSTALAAAGNTAGQVAFSLSLTGCTDVAGNVRTNFEAGTAVDSATGRLNNTAGLAGANNVQIQLLNGDDNSPIVVGASEPTQNSHAVALAAEGGAGTTGTATLNYFARYYATGAAGAGTVSSMVTYSLILP